MQAAMVWLSGAFKNERPQTIAACNIPLIEKRRPWLP